MLEAGRTYHIAFEAKERAISGQLLSQKAKKRSETGHPAERSWGSMSRARVAASFNCISLAVSGR
jgi:hypothetical protein